jgi:3'(2'), 5'-bisphosphate nucleotidase
MNPMNAASPVRTMPYESFDGRLLDDVIEIAREASAVIMPYFSHPTTVHIKADASPVTAADVAADALITRRLRQLTPELAVVSEESAACGGNPPGSIFWLVDPLDGTKEFINGRDEFTVNIALIENGVPVLGVVALPARDETYAGARGRGAAMLAHGARNPIRCRAQPMVGATVAVSRSHGDLAADGALLGETPIAGRIAAGSALKFCLVARGDADVYPRAGRTMEWDTAAGQAVLAAAGGNVFDRGGAPLTYGKPGFENPSFVARGICCPGG